MSRIKDPALLESCAGVDLVERRAEGQDCRVRPHGASDCALLPRRDNSPDGRPGYVPFQCEVFGKVRVVARPNTRNSEAINIFRAPPTPFATKDGDDEAYQFSQPLRVVFFRRIFMSHGSVLPKSRF